jgi:UDP-4-amino-4-deoxy-L-arabinose-oxoglutarate aminotransferase
MRALQEQNIGTGIHFIATHLHSWYRQRFPDLHLPNTEWNSERLCSIPLFPDMTLDDVNRVVDAIENTLEKSL